MKIVTPRIEGPKNGGGGFGWAVFFGSLLVAGLLFWDFKINLPPKPDKDSGQPS